LSKSFDAIESSISILVVDDDPEDREFTRRALEDIGYPVDCRFVADGEAAVDYLINRCGNATPLCGPRPDLIFLDLNLPRLGGHEVLTLVRQNEWLRHIPVLVLTTSSSNDDVTRSYLGGANAFITKPPDIEAYFRAVRSAGDFFLQSLKAARRG
jgi:two-component system response regulator